MLLLLYLHSINGIADMADKKKSKSSQPRRRRAAAQTAPAARQPQTPQAAQGALFVAPIAVRWRDLDAFNHVNNSSFLTYLEEARLQWLKGIPGPWFDAHAMPVLAASELNYRAPIAWPARVAVELMCERIGTSSLTLAHRIVDADDGTRLYCDGRVVLVWTDPATGKPVALPEAIRACA